MEATDLNKQNLIPNPQLLRGIAADNDVILVFSTYFWTDLEVPMANPKLFFHDVVKKEDLDVIDGGLIFLKFDPMSKDVLYLTHDQWLPAGMNDEY